MADKVEINEAGVVEDKPKRNNIIWVFVGAAIIFILIFLFLIGGVFSSHPSGTTNSNPGQANRTNP